MIYCISKEYYNSIKNGDKKAGIKGAGSYDGVLAYLNATAGIKGKIEQLVIN